MIVINILLCYIGGYLLTLFLLHTFKRQLGIDVYDEPHDGYYDDWNSNSEAYAGWSFGWPLLWLIFLLNGIWLGVCLLSAWLDDK